MMRTEAKLIIIRLKKISVNKIKPDELGIEIPSPSRVLNCA